ncbi:hypothetical protein L915_14964, partial [Phytophthora nicotianae]
SLRSSAGDTTPALPNRECGSNYNFLRQHQSHRHGPLRDTNCCEIDTTQAGNA